MLAVAAVGLYLATAAALLALAHRRLARLSSAAAAALVAVPLLLTGPAMLRGRAYGPFDLTFQHAPWIGAGRQLGIAPPRSPILSDLQCQIVPWRLTVRRVLAAGAPPLRNPYLLAGDLLAASGQPAPYSPLVLASLLLPPPAEPGYLAAVVLLLAALGAFLLARDLGAGETAAVVAGAAWAWSDPIAFWVGWPLGAAAALLPAVWLAVRRLVRAPGVRSAGLLAAVLALALLAGHPESVVHLVLLGGLVAIAELLAAHGRRLRAIAAGVAGGAVAALLCAVFLLPIVEALPQSSEYGTRRALALRPERSVPAAEAALRFARVAVPHLFGRPDAPAERSRYGRFGLEPVGPGAGVVVLGLAACGLAASRARGRWAIAATGLFAGLAGVAAPGISDLLARLPLTDVAINERLGFGCAAALAVLAGLGLDLALGGRPRTAAAWLAGTALAAAATAAALAPWMRATGLSRDFVVRGAAWSVAPALVAAAVLAAPAVARRRVAIAAVVLAALAVQRRVEVGGIYPDLAAAAFYPRVPLLDALPHGGPPYRVVGVGGALLPNLAAVYGLEDVRGYQALQSARLHRTFPLWCEADVWFNRVFDLQRPFLSFLGVRFAVAPAGYAPPPGWEVAARARDAVLLRNRRALPRAFVPREVRLGGSLGAVGAGLAAERDFAQRAWIETPGDAARIEPAILPNGPGRVQAIREAPDRYAMRVRCRAACWVVISETAWKGWRATIDGEATPLAFANHAFLAVRVPAGDHALELVYRPRSFVVGAAVSVATAGCLLGAALVRRRRAGSGRAEEFAASGSLAGVFDSLAVRCYPLRSLAPGRRTGP